VDRSEAAAQLAKAASLFEPCGARWRSKRVLATLGTLGHPGARSRTSLLRPPLSRREDEVVRLALHGITAREIGQELGIGERTVETHLANAYAKLGVSSRLDLARRAAQLGLN
jgi:DNA-binding CsgD family transcriptional regulator